MAQFFLKEKKCKNLICTTFLIHDDDQGNMPGVVWVMFPDLIPDDVKVIGVYNEECLEEMREEGEFTFRTFRSYDDVMTGKSFKS